MDGPPRSICNLTVMGGAGLGGGGGLLDGPLCFLDLGFLDTGALEVAVERGLASVGC